MVIGNMSSRDGGIVGARSRRRGWLATADSPKSCPIYCWLIFRNGLTQSTANRLT